MSSAEKLMFDKAKLASRIEKIRQQRNQLAIQLQNLKGTGAESAAAGLISRSTGADFNRIRAITASSGAPNWPDFKSLPDHTSTGFIVHSGT